MDDIAPAPLTDASEHHSFWRRPGVIGSCLGILSAIAYTTANLGLRHVAPGGDLDWAIFVTANKATPVSLIAWGLVCWRMSRGLTGMPPRNLILPLIGTGLVMQFGGNLMFQFALSQGGLALTVPLTFSTIIMTGAILGRLVLNEPITPRLLLAMAIMMCAVAVLSGGARTAAEAHVFGADWRTTVLAVVTGCLSGVGYGACGVMVRRCVTSNMAYSSTIVLISSVGLFVFWPIALVRLGPSHIFSQPSSVWLSMFGAGLANAIAFFSVNAAYKRLPVIRVNLLNGSQAAMAGIAGVVLFSEPNTRALQIGTLLTVTGLILSAQRKGRVSSKSTGHPKETVATVPALVTSQDHVD